MWCSFTWDVTTLAIRAKIYLEDSQEDLKIVQFELENGGSAGGR